MNNNTKKLEESQLHYFLYNNMLIATQVFSYIYIPQHETTNPHTTSPTQHLLSYTQTGQIASPHTITYTFSHTQTPNRLARMHTGQPFNQFDKNGPASHGSTQPNPTQPTHNKTRFTSLENKYYPHTHRAKYVITSHYPLFIFPSFA